MNIGKEKKMNKEEAIEYIKNYKYDNEVRQAIDTVLAYIADLEKENAVKESHIKIVSAYNKELEKRLKEKENIVKKSSLEAQKYFDMLMEVEYGRNTIPKQKIRDKIEELKEIADEDNKEEFIKIDVLEELLEEEK